MIIVTGGAGFIGSRLVARLEKTQNEPIVVIDHLGHLSAKNEKWRNLRHRRIADFVTPEDFFAWLKGKDGDVSQIFHLGASSATTETNIDFIMAQNFTFTLKLWDWCAEFKKDFIYASSAATYGNGDEGFADKDDLDYLKSLKPLNPYGWSKALCDYEFARRAQQGQSTPPKWAGVKFFNVYGPHEYHKEGQRSVAHQMFQSIQDKGEVSLFRSHHEKYEDGGQMRDFVFVEDCVDILLFLSKFEITNGIYNAGSGKARSFYDLAKACFNVLGKDENIEWIDTPPDIRRHYQYFTEATMGKIRAAGYDKPATTLEDGVETYINDYLLKADPYD